MQKTLADLAKACKKEGSSAEAAHFIKALEGKQKVAVMVGALAMQHPQAAELRHHASTMATALNGSLSLMTDGANTAGAWLTGAISNPAAGGLNAYEMLKSPRSAYLLLNVEPDMDCINPQQAVAAMQKAKFVVALSTYHNPVLEAHANVILPVAAFTETSGSYINAEGRLQTFNGMANAFEEARPAWKVLRVLATLCILMVLVMKAQK